MRENDQEILVVCPFINFNSLFYLLLPCVSSHHITSALRFVCVRVAPAHVCGKRASGTCARSCVCVYKIKIICKEKNGTFHVYYPPAMVCCSYVLYVLVCTRMLFVCYSYVTRMYSHGTRMYSYVTRMILVWTRMLLVCTRMLLVCTRVVF